MINADERTIMRIQACREKIRDLLNSIERSEALGVLTMAMAELMIDMAESEDQYNKLVDKMNDFMIVLPTILRVMDEEVTNSVKH